MLVELVYNERRMLNWKKRGWDPWLDMYMPRSKELLPELAKRFPRLSPRDTPWSRILDWIDALLMDAGCLYDLNGKLIGADGKFRRKYGEWLKKTKTPAWKRIDNKYRWHWWEGECCKWL